MKKIGVFIFALVFLITFVSATHGANFAIYNGAGTWEPSKTAFKNFLNWKGLTWEEVDKKVINNMDLRPLYGGIFMPGGWAGDYNRDIKPSGDQHIRDLISNGGAYIGMSAGAYYACDNTIWEGNNYDYPSDIFDGDCIGPIPEIAPWPNYIMTTMSLNQTHSSNIYEPVQRNILYYGEPYFVIHPGQEMQTFASWIVPANPVANGKPGIIGFDYGQGRVLLVGPHPEIEEDDSRDGTNFADELSDGPDGSDWSFLWTAVDWLRQVPITLPPGTLTPQCSDGLDNDGDTFIDYPADPGCSSIADNNEVNPTQCSDGIDNDADNAIDFSNDFGCSSATDNDEVNNGLTQCSDGIDNDFDSFADQNDLGCANYLDNDETNPTGPQQIFSDNFESGNLNGWTTSAVSGGNSWTNSNTNPYQGTRHAQSQPMSTTEPASILERSISTAGYNNINFSYYRKLMGLDAADEFKAKWFNGATWTVLEQTGSSSANDASYAYRQFTLPTGAGNNPGFKIRFECTAGAVSEFCRVDNVLVMGQ